MSLCERIAFRRANTRLADRLRDQITQYLQELTPLQRVTYFSEIDLQQDREYKAILGIRGDRHILFRDAQLDGNHNLMTEIFIQYMPEQHMAVALYDSMPAQMVSERGRVMRELSVDQADRLEHLLRRLHRVERRTF